MSFPSSSSFPSTSSKYHVPDASSVPETTLPIHAFGGTAVSSHHESNKSHESDIHDPSHPQLSRHDSQTNKTTGSISEPNAQQGIRVRKYATWYHIWALGILGAISGCSVIWNITLSYGFGPAILVHLLIGLAYTTMIMSYSELSACIPFSGGAFGFVRATMGVVPALLVAAAESLEYILCVCISVMQLAQILTALAGLSEKYDILWYILIYGIALATHIWGGRIMWTSILGSALLGISCLLIYWLTCWSYHDLSFQHNARVGVDDGQSHSNQWFVGESSGIIKIIPLAVWWFRGIESTPLAAEESHRPRTSIARGTNRAVLTILIITFVTLMTGVSMPPGIVALSQAPFPLSAGVDLVWNAHESGDSTTTLRNSTLLLSIPGIWCTIQGFMYAYGRQIHSLSRAGHQPKTLEWTTHFSGTPWVSLVYGSTLGFVIALIIRAQDTPGYIDGCNIILSMMLLVTLFCYMMVLVSFIMMRVRHAQVARTYKSRLGIPGAVVSIGLFLLCFISIWVYQPHIRQAAIALFIWFVCNLLYYILYSRHHTMTILSAEEKFAVYLQVTAQKMLSTVLGYNYLHVHCEKEFSTESIECWARCSNFLQKPSSHSYLAIYNQHLKTDAPEPVNIPGEMSWDAHNFANLLSSSTTTRISPQVMKSIRLLIIRIQNEILQLLNKDTVPRFKTTPEFHQYLAQEPLDYLDSVRAQARLPPVTGRASIPSHRLSPPLSKDDHDSSKRNLQTPVARRASQDSRVIEVVARHGNGNSPERGAPSSSRRISQQPLIEHNQVMPAAAETGDSVVG